jgi:8-oxo-dGTP pyrophosphatase MutT (NUDIX family)
VFDVLVGASTIVGAVLALVAVVVAVGMGTVAWQRFFLVRLRWRHVGSVLREGRPELSRREFVRSASALLERRIDGLAPLALQELGWLSSLVGAVQDEPLYAERVNRVRVPVTFGPVGAGAELSVVADAYTAYGAAVRRRRLLRTAAAPIVAGEYECAVRTAQLLREYARQEPLAPAPDSWSERVKDLRVDLASPAEGVAAWVRLRAWPDVRLSRRSAVFAGITVSGAPYRVVTSGSAAERSAPVEVQTLSVSEPGEVQPSEREFDGVMTRLHGAEGFRVEVDPQSGRQVLHLCLSETSFFAFRLTQWHQSDPERSRPAHAYVSRLLSVNLVLVDDGGRALLVRRAASVSHGARFAGAASGACETTGRVGIRPDLDADGRPNPMAAIVREAAEELGVDIAAPSGELGALGLVEVMSPRDMHTHVLTATARIPGDARAFRVEVGSTDDVEGTWELGADALVVDVEHVLSTEAALRSFIGWLRSAPEVLPHGVGALLLLVVARLELRVPLGDPAAPALDVLLDAMTVPVDPDARWPSSATLQPLF